jgi:undecaprenyl-diphosphatase
VGPEVRFIWDRLTPGGLGLELTTCLAVASAGLFAFFAYAMTLSEDPGPTPIDSRTFELIGHLQSRTAVDVFKVVTNLGAAPTVGVIVLLTALVLAARRRPYELAALLGGAVGVYVWVQLSKAAIDRPRPSGSLVSTNGDSYPSGHAAYSTAWVACAVALTRVVPGLASRAGLVAGGLVVSAVVGLSRVYLRAHYLSDVVGGWGLGFGIFGACASVAVIVAFIRQYSGKVDATPAAARQR